jgi:hypothetical protein
MRAPHGFSFSRKGVVVPRKTLVALAMGAIVAYEAYVHGMNFLEKVAYELATGGWASRERQSLTKS